VDLIVRSIPIVVAGTESSDSPTDAVGGIVDGGTASDQAAVKDALRRVDAGSYLRQCDDILIAGGRTPM